MDMSNVKAIFDNNAQKNVKKITDADGNILWYKVPDGYRKVEWLGTDGNAYIDTGVKPSLRDKHEAVFNFDRSNSTGQVLFSSVKGVWDAIPNNWLIFRPYQSATINRFTLWYRFTPNSANSVTQGGENAFIYTDKERLIIEQLSSNNVHIKLNSYNVNVYRVREEALDEEQPNYWLLRYQTAEGTLNNSMKIYYYRLSQYGQIVRHFIPLVRLSDEKPGMYDLVNDVFYTNAGTGEFTRGEIQN